MQHQGPLGRGLAPGHAAGQPLKDQQPEMCWGKSTLPGSLLQTAQWAERRTCSKKTTPRNMETLRHRHTQTHPDTPRHTHTHAHTHIQLESPAGLVQAQSLAWVSRLAATHTPPSLTHRSLRPARVRSVASPLCFLSALGDPGPELQRQCSVPPPDY